MMPLQLLCIAPCSGKKVLPPLSKLTVVADRGLYFHKCGVTVQVWHHTNGLPKDD